MNKKTKNLIDKNTIFFNYDYNYKKRGKRWNHYYIKIYYF